MKYPILLFALVPLLSGCAKWEQKQFDASLVGLTPEQRTVVAVVSGRDTGVDPAQYLSPSAIALGQQFRAEEQARDAARRAAEDSAYYARKQQRDADTWAQVQRNQADLDAYVAGRQAASNAIVADAAARNARDVAAAAPRTPLHSPPQSTQPVDPLAPNSAMKAEAAQARKGAGTDLCPNSISDIECANRLQWLQEQAHGKH
jgi:hypothetical protein